MTMKQPDEGGAWEWHQDFGYWYNYGCLAPDMMSIYVALDKATKENGCLQVLKGTHKLGRLNHIREDDQTNVEQETSRGGAEALRAHLCRDGGGRRAGVSTAICCTARTPTRSDTYRWGYICSYNRGGERAVQAGARLWQLRAAEEGAGRQLPHVPERRLTTTDASGRLGTKRAAALRQSGRE